MIVLLAHSTRNQGLLYSSSYEVVDMDVFVWSISP